MRKSVIAYVLNGMREDIIPIPRIPDGLREAAQRGTLIPFIGAGASRIAGCPGWSEFADGALRHFVQEGKRKLTESCPHCS
jgi:hypothetical protein